MPRSPDGAYSLPPGTIVSSGDTLLPSQHNPAMQDIAAALGNSLDRNGAGGMRAPLDMGGYQARNMAAGTAPNDGATVAQTQTNGIPIGMPGIWFTDTPPAGWLLCYGQAVSRTTYPDLFARWGVRFGSGDGTTTFNLPDLRGVTFVGRDDMGGLARGLLTAATSLGAVVGSQNVTLSQEQMPSHSHSVNDPGHQHGYTSFQSSPGSAIDAGNGVTETAPRTTAFATTGITVAAAGGGQAHPNVQPSFVVNIIVKASN